MVIRNEHLRLITIAGKRTKWVGEGFEPTIEALRKFTEIKFLETLRSRAVVSPSSVRLILSSKFLV